MMTQPAAQPHPEDLFHPAADDPWWYESYWFSCFVPERRLMVYVYPWFRAGLGTCGGGVLAWDDRAREPWDIVHADYSWHLPCPDPAALVDGNVLTLPQGVRITVLEPLTAYRVEYSHDRLSLDLTFRATGPADINTRPIGDSQLFGGRIDQCGRVTGSLTLLGERIAVDCHSMRDRSWGPRRDDNRGMHLGYHHASASDGDAFLAIIDASKTDREGWAPVATGYLIQDGVRAPLVTGRARMDRDADATPAVVSILAEDGTGRRLEAAGRSLSPFAYQPFPGMFNWSSLAEWQFNGHSCLGELQDTWYPDDWRAFRRRGAGWE